MFNINIENRYMQFRSDAGFANLLSTVRSTLMVSAYLSGRIVLVSAIDGRIQIRSHQLDRPMGLAVSTDLDR